MNYLGPKFAEPYIRQMFDLCVDKSVPQFDRKSELTVIAAPVISYESTSNGPAIKIDTELCDRIDDAYESLNDRYMDNDGFLGYSEDIEKRVRYSTDCDIGFQGKWHDQLDKCINLATLAAPHDDIEPGAYDIRLDAVLIKPAFILGYMTSLFIEDMLRPVDMWNPGVYLEANAGATPEVFSYRLSDEANIEQKHFRKIPAQILSDFYKWDLSDNRAFNTSKEIMDLICANFRLKKGEQYQQAMGMHIQKHKLRKDLILEFVKLNRAGIRADLSRTADACAQTIIPGSPMLDPPAEIQLIMKTMRQVKEFGLVPYIASTKKKYAELYPYI